jgi:hypothetical protein
MKPTSFEGQNLTLGKGQPEYLELPALVCNDTEGTVWSCWELDEEDIKDLIKNKRIWVGQLTFKNRFAPQLITTVIPFEVSFAMNKNNKG